MKTRVTVFADISRGCVICKNSFKFQLGRARMSCFKEVQWGFQLWPFIYGMRRTTVFKKLVFLIAHFFAVPLFYRQGTKKKSSRIGWVDWEPNSAVFLFFRPTLYCLCVKVHGPWLPFWIYFFSVNEQLVTHTVRGKRRNKRVKMRQQRRKGKGMPVALSGIFLVPEINYKTPGKNAKTNSWGTDKNRKGSRSTNWDDDFQKNGTET